MPDTNRFRLIWIQQHIQTQVTLQKERKCVASFCAKLELVLNIQIQKTIFEQNIDSTRRPNS